MPGIRRSVQVAAVDHRETLGLEDGLSGFDAFIASHSWVLLGGAVEIYSFSNVGYTISFIPVLIGYYLLRKDQPNLRRPFKLPEYMKYVALLLAAVYFVFWLFGGLWYSKIGNVEVYY